MDSWIQNLTLATNFYIDPVFMDSIQKQEVPNNLGLAGHLDLSQSKVNKTMFCKIIIFTISTSLLKVLSSPILERQIWAFSLVFLSGCLTNKHFYSQNTCCLRLWFPCVWQAMSPWTQYHYFCGHFPRLFRDSKLLLWISHLYFSSGKEIHPWLLLAFSSAWRNTTVHSAVQHQSVSLRRVNHTWPISHTCASFVWKEYRGVSWPMPPILCCSTIRESNQPVRSWCFRYLDCEAKTSPLRSPKY